MTIHFFRNHIAFGAILGISVGVMISISLLFLVKGEGEEAMEGAAMLAYFISFPARLLIDLCDSGWRADRWPWLIAIAPPLNGAVVGAAVGCFTAFFARLFHREYGEYHE